MTDRTLLTAVRHSCWANLQLLDLCAGLRSEQLAWTAPGTYGSIHACLQHIVGAEHGYLFALTGELPPNGPLAPEPLVPLEDLIVRARGSAERIERALAAEREPGRVVQRRRGGTATVAIFVAQLVHHGSDHRAHVGTIIGAHGVDGPDIDVWSYGLTIGEVTSG